MPHPLVLALLLAPLLSRADTLDVPRLAAAPTLDGRADEREYGAPTIRIAAGAGEVRVWVARHGDALHIAAALPDSTPYWGDDLVVSLDPDGSGGAAPGDGDRQWYLRRALDSSTVVVASGGRWFAAGRLPPMLGPARAGDDWAVASASTAMGWSVELRVRAGAARTGAALPRLALRTYDDRPHGWWSWPPPPAGTAAVRVERNPDLWVALRMP